MVLDVTDAIKQQEKVFTFSLSENYGSLEYGGDTFVFDNPVKAEGQYSCKADICFVGGTISAAVESSCARCLEPVKMTIQAGFEEEFARRADPDFPDRHVFSGDRIVLDEIVLANIVLDMPIRVLCSEDCRGLCPKCGQNLNTGSCSCKSDL